MVNGLKVYYPIEGGVNVKRQAVANSILKNENARTMVTFLSAHPGAHQREMARALGVNHGTIRWHLRKLVEAEVINELREGSHFRYFLTPEGMQRAMTAIGTQAPAPPPTTPALEQQVEVTAGAPSPASAAAQGPPADDEPASEPGF
jgi:DNA-binding MarR family transcriptional regulator